MFKISSHDPFEHLQPQVMAKKKAGSQSVNLTPDH
jgi:hypothetical protein